MTFGVYLLIRNHIVVYVGQTWQIETRIRNHRSDKKKEFDRYHFFKCPAENLNWFEQELIERFKPIYNKQTKVNNYFSLMNAIRKEMRKLAIEASKK